MQRCWAHDYCEPCYYMITVVTEPRRECLSRLTGDSLILTPTGEVVKAVWERTSLVYKNVEACESVLMPDHFHGILRVKTRLARPMGHIVKAFKRVSRDECRSKGLLLPSNLWEEGFQDSILLRGGQLQRMVNYIADHPRRLAAKRANPELFTVTSQHLIANHSYTMIGNRYLLDHPLKRQVRISRRITDKELAEQKEELLYAAEHGAVLVSPCISPGEKAVDRAAMPPYYKPPGSYFAACAAGRLLMLAPFPYQEQERCLNRERCLRLNQLTQLIVRNSNMEES